MALKIEGLDAEQRRREAEMIYGSDDEVGGMLEGLGVILKRRPSTIQLQK